MDLLRRIRQSEQHQFLVPRKIDPDPEYEEWIEKRSPKVQENSLDTVNTRDHRYGCDEINKFNELRREFEDNVIIFVDRTRWQIEMDCSSIQGTQGYYSFIGPKPGEFSMHKGKKKYTILCRTAPCGCKDCSIGDFEECKYNGEWYTQDEKHIILKRTKEEIKEEVERLDGGRRRQQNKASDLFPDPFLDDAILVEQNNENEAVVNEEGNEEDGLPLHGGEIVEL